MSNLNDPRVLFAAERTLLAWNRTSLALMGFGFVIERFGLFLHYIARAGSVPAPGRVSFWLGVSFVVLGSVLSVLSVLQYRRLLRGMKPIEIPDGYWVHLIVFTNLMVGVLGVALAVYLTVAS